MFTAERSSQWEWTALGDSSLHLPVKGNAKIEGLITDLNMTNGQYNACLTIFFISYVSQRAYGIYFISPDNY